MPLLRLALVALSFMCLATPSPAQEYPTKPIRVIVPFPPGGGTDILGRVVANKMSDTLKWAMVVDNKPGAGGNIGVELAAKAPADGYTMVLGQTSNLAINPTLYPSLPYDPVKDLAPVALVASAPLALVVSANSRFRSIADVVAASKGKPGDLTFASPGNGTVSHLAGELLQGAAGIKFRHIPYKGSAQALTDLMAGSVDLFMSSVPTAMSQIKGGSIRAIAVTGAKRSREMPDVPTVAESGYPGFEAATWFGFLVRAGTPQPIVDRLNAEINRALGTPEVQQRIAAEGAEPLGGTPAAFSTFLKAELAKWAPIVKESGANVD